MKQNTIDKLFENGKIYILLRQPLVNIQLKIIDRRTKTLNSKKA